MQLSMILDPRGPILEPGNLPIVATQSIQSGRKAVPVGVVDFGPRAGKWIWFPSEVASPVRFKRSIEVEGTPKRVRTWIAADVRYRMWVNGVLASRGPADVGRDYDSPPCGPWFEDVRDLTWLFHEGKNVVAVEVFPMALVGNEWPMGHPGLKADFEIRSADGTSQIVGTDARWLCSPAADLDQSGARNGYRAKMSLEPVGWQIRDTDPSGWCPSCVSTNQIPTTISELAPPLESIVVPIGFTRVSAGVTPHSKNGGAEFAADGSYSIRFGHILSGYLGLKIKGHAGARLMIMPNEHDAPGYNRRAEILLREGVQIVDLPYFDSFSVVNIQVDGVREPITVEDVRCVFTSYPVRYLGRFACSKPEFNRIWEVCRWCTQICMQTHHLDSPHHQEPVSDAGDYLIESLNSLYAFGEGTLARQDLKKIARTLKQRGYQSFHTSYSLMWLQMLMQYYDYTGDSKTVKELAPTAFALLDRFEGYLGRNGLISEAPNYMFMDWVEVEGFTLHHPPAVIGQGYMTALYYRALEDGIRVAALLKDVAREKRFATLRDRISRAFEAELWSPGVGLYRDGKPFQTSVKPNQWLPADKNIETFTTQGNTFAVACGLVPRDRASAIMEKVVTRTDMHCQPYFMHFVFRALAEAGDFEEYATRLLNRWHIVPDTQSFHEMWDTGDLSHAWNGTPLYQMSGQILGIRPVEPGFKKFVFAPCPSGLDWAEGAVPTPYGTIEAAWKKEKNGYEIRLTVPKGTIGMIAAKLFRPGHYHLHEFALK